MKPLILANFDKSSAQFMKSAIKLLLQIGLFLALTQNSFASGLRLIRDSETEDLLYKITRPLIKAAGLNEEDIAIYIVNDQSLNAFVAGGQNIFINTGLITKYEDPNILTGVIAHEMGHISAGHLARGGEAMRQVNNIAILTYLAGIAAAVTANSDAGYAILMGGSNVSEKLAMKFSRTQEEAADKLAVQYLQKTHNSPAGLMNLLEYFNQEESISGAPIDEYARSHPVSQKRVNYIKSTLSLFKDTKGSDPLLAQEMKYVVAKLRAFLSDDNNQNLVYFGSNSPYDKYARSIIYFKKGDLKKSLFEIDSLIKSQPKNGYFHELKGQILFESGKVKESIKSYKNAISLLPNPALAKVSLSGAILTLKTNDQDLVNFAIKNLDEAKKLERNNGQIFSELAKAYLKLEENGKSYLALSELNLLRQDNKKARKYAGLALENLKENEDKSDWLKAKDIIEAAKDKNKKDEDDDKPEKNK